MPGKRTQPSKRTATLFSASTKHRSSTTASAKLKPSLLGLKPPVKPSKKGTHKARDADVRAKLDDDRDALRAALEGPDKNKALVEKKEAPKELARGGDSLAQSMDEVLDLFGAA
ncbi:hypothetical protein JCM8208_003178 [Rhodotorula glutinis]